MKSRLQNKTITGCVECKSSKNDVSYQENSSKTSRNTEVYNFVIYAQFLLRMERLVMILLVSHN